MKLKFTQSILVLSFIFASIRAEALTGGDVNVKLISGYFWMDNSCTVAGPQGKVVSFRIINTKGSAIQGLRITLGTITFTATGSATYNSGTPSFQCRTSNSIYLGNLAAGDSVTAFFFVGYNCLIYPNNTNITTDYITLPVTLSDNLSGTVSTSFNKLIYVLRNSNNNTITILATSTNTIGTLATISVAYNISNVKPGNIIDMELSTLSTFPAGYEIVGCRITASSIPNDFPVNMINTHYSNSITSNLPSGGTVTIEWTLKITGTQTGLTSSNLVPFVVSDAGSAQRWQANTTAFTGTSTPVNPITISKRVNEEHVLIGDTVRYTIVISNSSSVADVTIDRLADNMPRNYQFRYLEIDTTVFPRLVTYSNSTLVPEYLDTNILDFYGGKNMGGGEFSWVVPSQDSIKLIYSVVVSDIPGLRDTNFISAYVGSSNIGTSFSVVNVYTFLPLKLVYFNAASTEDGNVELNWAINEESEGSRYEIYRHNHLNGEFEKVTLVYPGSGQQVFSCMDYKDPELKSDAAYYRLVHFKPDGSSDYYDTYLDKTVSKDAYRIINNEGEISIYAYSGITNKPIDVSVFNLSGQIIKTLTLYPENGYYRFKSDFNSGDTAIIFVSVYSGDLMQTEKLLIR